MTSRKPRTKRTPIPPRELTWRDFPDSTHRPLTAMPCAPSLRPGLKLMLDLVNGSSVARAICDSWNPKLFFSTLIVVEYD